MPEAVNLSKVQIQPPSFLDEVGEAKKVAPPPPFCYDTIERTPVGEELDSPPASPQLESPKKIDFAAVMQEIDDVFGTIEVEEEVPTEPEPNVNPSSAQISDNPAKPPLSEGQLFKEFVSCMKQFYETMQSIELSSYDEATLQFKLLKQIKELHFEIDNIVKERTKTSELLGWVDTSATCTLAAASLGAYLTGGTSTVLSLATAGSGLVKGGAQIGSSYVNYKLDQELAELASVKTLKKGIEQHHNNELDVVSDMMETIFGLMSNIREILEARKQIQVINLRS